MSNQEQLQLPYDFEQLTEKVDQILSEIYSDSIQLNEEQHDAADIEEEYCIICYTNELSVDPCVTLNCGHIFHIECVRELLSHKWNTLRISFSFLKCPTCKQDIQASALQADLAQFRDFKASVEEMALKVGQSQGLENDSRYTSESSTYHGNLQGLAMHACSFYQCNKCKKAYFGGMIDCAEDLDIEESAKKEELLCKDCQLQAFGAGDALCQNHGTKHIEWKCLYCCSIAVYFCYGTHYFCQRCHEEFVVPPKNSVELRDCNGVNCPLGVPHPPADPDYKLSTFPLGCSLCKSDKGPPRTVKIQEVCLEIIKYKAAPQIILNPIQRQILEKERQDKIERERESKFQSLAERAQARKEQALRNKELRELQLQSMLLNVDKCNKGAAYLSSDDEGSPTHRNVAQIMTDENSTTSQIQRPIITVAEQRKQQLVAKRLATAARTQANLIKLHEQREAKIAALDAKLDKIEDTRTNAQRVKDLAEKQRGQIRAAHQKKTRPERSDTTSYMNV